MYQILTKRLTKPVSYCTFALIISSLSVSTLAQEDEPASLIDPTPELQEGEAETELSTADEGSEYSGPNTVDVEEDSSAEDITEEVIDENKLEDIDEASVTYQDEGKEVSDGEEQVETATPLSQEVEDLKKAALELNRDLLILEEELLFPANSQIVVFLSLDVGEYFDLDSVKLLIDDKLIASHLYTRRQNTALSLGGIQRLYLGNLKSGDHEVTAFFVGVGPENREYKRGATIIIEKDDDPKLLELKVRDSSANMQPEFGFEEWQL